MEDMNIWEIDATGLEVEKDYTLSDDDDNDAYVIKQKVPANRLKLIQ